MCTCNGAGYIRGQLDSILSQTVPVDEIVICDDCSTDSTGSILREYSAKHPCIKIHFNEQRLGVCANFDKALHLCSGELLFLSDQDDLWADDKVETILKYFSSHPGKSVVFTDALLIDDADKPLREKSNSLFKALRFNHFARLLFNCGLSLDILMLHYRVTGATVALRRTYLSGIVIDHSATPQNLKPLHDVRIAVYAAMDNVLGYIAKPLIRYRIHEGQQAGLGDRNLKFSNNILISSGYSACETITASRILTDELNTKFKFVERRKILVGSAMGPVGHFGEYHDALGKTAVILWPHDCLHSCYRALKYHTASRL